MKGADASANIFSLVITAKSNGINPYDYLKMIFEELPKPTMVEEYERLLPENFIKISR